MATKNQNSGGYDCNFLSEPADALKCLICLAVARDPRQHEGCGKLFCSECIEKYGRKKPCPNCKKTGSKFYKDQRSRRDIAALQVTCDNFKKGCDWEGTVGTLQQHVCTCKFALVPCPKQCEDDNNQVRHFMRKNLDKHLVKDCPNREYTCEYCEEKGKYVEITLIHNIICPKKIVPCPNSGCTDTMQRQHVEEHVATECEYTRTPCKYRRLGCETELKRKDMAAHEEDDKPHLRMAMDVTAELQDSTRKLLTVYQEMNKKLVDKVTALQEKSISFTFTDYEERKNDDEVVSSPPYYTSPNGYCMEIEVHADGSDSSGTHLSVFARFLHGKNDDLLKWPFVGTLTFTLLNQLEDKNHYKDELQLTSEDDADAYSDEAWGIREFIPNSKLGFDPIKKTQYLKDDTLYFKLSVKKADHKPWLES